ncbi:unnamed protein product, partial [Ectocarpus sp. 13 AM-2016]
SSPWFWASRNGREVRRSLCAALCCVWFRPKTNHHQPSRLDRENNTCQYLQPAPCSCSSCVRPRRVNPRCTKWCRLAPRMMCTKSRSHTNRIPHNWRICDPRCLHTLTALALPCFWLSTLR